MKGIIFTFLLLISHVAGASLVLQTDTTKLARGKTFRVVLTKDDAMPSGLPDLTPLQKDFRIIGTEQSTNYSVVNGKASSTNQWILLLQPKHAGRLTIPAIRLGQEITNSSTIEVTEADDSDSTTPADDDQDDQKDVKLVTSVSTRHPFVNEQVIYTVKLFNRKRLADATFQPPRVTDALLIPLGDSKRSQTYENGQLYLVEEQQYALFPQHSGSFKIDAPVFAALIYEDLPRQVKATTAATTLKVKPSPAGIGAKDWLPAKRVTLEETYDRDTTTVAEGSTIVRTITVQATGLPAQLLPAITVANTDNFNVYPEKPSESNKLSQDGLIGTRTMKITYLLNKAGKTVIPAQRLKWFNTLTNREETATLPALSLNVTASLNTPPTDKKADLPLTQGIKVDNTTAPSATMATSDNARAWWVAAGFAFLWLMTLLAWWKRPRLRFAKGRERAALNQLRQACDTRRPSLAKIALLRWAAIQWPDARLLSLADISALTHDPALQKQIDELTRALYQTSNKLWHGNELWRCVSSFKKALPVTARTDEFLPAMNPSDKSCSP